VGRRLAVVAVTLLAAARAAEAQNSADEQARRLLEDGRTYWTQGKLKQAIDNFNTIVTGFPNTDSVDDALLEIGRYHLEVEGNVDKAREAFDRVAKQFPQSDGAPGAYYYTGWLSVTRAAGPADLEDALAQFDRLQRLYPRSEWVPKALYASGIAHRKAGRLPEAVEAERRVSLEYPNSEAASAAQYQIGHCLGLMGEPLLAMEEFQRVRNRFPESEWAGPALERSTGLYRLYGAGKPTFSPDAAFSVGAGDVLKDVRAILMTPARTLWLASDKANAAIPFDPAGKMGSSLASQDVRSLSLSPRGDVLLASRLAVRIGPKDVKSFAVPGDKPGVLEPLEHITSAVVTPGGSLLVADEDKKRVYRFDARYEYKGTFPDAKPREVIRMTVDGEGGIVLLDKDDKSVRVFDEAGKPLRALAARGAGYELKRPVDVAMDPQRNAYVADEEGSVLVFSPQGQLLTSLAGEAVRKPRALTLDPSGAVLVYDEKAQRVVRFK
jgi:outer membrane protein assembly factor BamD (BamD/ComL family)